MSKAMAVIDIGILAYPGAQAASLHGLTDMFAVANRLCAEQGIAQAPTLRVSHWRLDARGLEAGGEVSRTFACPDRFSCGTGSSTQCRSYGASRAMRP